MTITISPQTLLYWQKHIHTHICIYICVCVCVEKKEKKNPNLMNISMITIKRFSFIKPSSGLYDGEKNVAWTTIGSFFIKIMGEEKVYTVKDS